MCEQQVGLRKLGRGSKGEAAMRSRFVVLYAPRFNRALRVGETDKPALVQALVAESPVKAFGEAVLDRFAWANEVERDAPVMRPLIKGLARKLGSVVADN